MVSHKTCLVVGAGWSVPYGLPSGSELRDLIVLKHSERARATAMRFPVFDPSHNNDFDVRHFHGESDFHREDRAVTIWSRYLLKMLGDAGCSQEDWSSFTKEFFRGKSRSIDRFVQFHHEEWGNIGRACVAAILINCERNSCLDKDWYEELLDQVAPNPTALKRDRLSIITFNYDRSFEQYFRNAFSAQFGLTESEATDVFQRIEVEHVYGSLGEWNKDNYGHSSTIQAAAQIDFMRVSESHPRRDHLNQLLREAENVCFLGFSFAEENLKIFDRDVFQKKNLLLATSLGLSQGRMAEVQKVIRGIKFHDVSCLELLRLENIFRERRSTRVNPAVNTRPKVAFKPWEVNLTRHHS